MELKAIKRCHSCRWEKLDVCQEPCYSCNVGDKNVGTNWEPKDTAEAERGEE